MEYINQVLQGHAIDILKSLPDGIVQTCVTSPPYFGLRSYGTKPQIWGGDPNCPHEWETFTRKGQSGGVKSKKVQIKGSENFQIVPDAEQASCARCGAWYGEYGAEPCVESYVVDTVAIFREVRRVLRDDGTLWLNIGDTFSDKRLLGVPWRVAFALQEDGWILRSDIIWAKANPMPESVNDRPTKSHEYIFLLTKNDKYFYDADAIREEYASIKTGSAATFNRENSKRGESICPNSPMPTHRPDREDDVYGHNGRNKRSVWTVATQAFSEAHFAVFPKALIEPCVLAGTSQKGCCPKCGTPIVRVVDHPGNPQGILGRAGVPNSETRSGGFFDADVAEENGKRLVPGHNPTQFYKGKTTGWAYQCKCGIDDLEQAVPCLVLDPFGGSGTTGIVAKEQDRRWILIELNPKYRAMAEKRIAKAYHQTTLEFE